MAEGSTSCELDEQSIALDGELERELINEEPSLFGGDHDQRKLLVEWTRQQQNMKSSIVLDDQLSFDAGSLRSLRYIGGADVSFVKDDPVNACAALVVLDFPTLEVLYSDVSLVKLDLPYIPGYLSFREGHFIVDKLQTVLKDRPEIYPQVLFVDGNGILHPRGVGLASHIGVCADVPTVGVAKKLFHVDGILKDEEHHRKIREMSAAGDSFPLSTADGSVLGKAVLTSGSCTNPVYVSVGHRLSLDTAVRLVNLCSKYRVPEPVRQADIQSREYIRDNFKAFS